jgi:predicted flavoprotein YhiN
MIDIVRTPQGKVLVLERTREAGKKVLMSGGTRCNVLPCEVDLSKDYFTDSSKSALRAIFASWSIWECWSWLSDEAHVGLPLSLEEESNKWFPTSNSSREVRDRLVAACEYVVPLMCTVLAAVQLFEQRIVPSPIWRSGSCCRRRGVQFQYNADVVGMHEEASGSAEEEPLWKIDLADGSSVRSHRVILATGGLSFPKVVRSPAPCSCLSHRSTLPAMTNLRSSRSAAWASAGGAVPSSHTLGGCSSGS